MENLPLKDRSHYRKIDCRAVDRWYCGLDVGQQHDPSAFCALNHKIIPGGEWVVNDKTETLTQSRTERFELRYLERLPLKLSYVEQVNRVATLLSREPLDKAQFGLDFVSVGRPIAELFQRALRGRTVYRVLTTSGNEVTKHSGVEWHVPKIVLVSQLESRLHSGEFRIAADLAEAGALVSELQDFSRKVSEAGRVTFDARGGSAHDDMVFCVCVAMFLATHGRVNSSITR